MNLLFLILFHSFVFAAEELIQPPVTGAGIYRINSDHIVVTPARPRGKLLITIGGTGSRTEEFRHVIDWASEKGYHVIAVDYPNGVISTICQKSPDKKCFDQYREEIILGHPVSALVNVNEANSLLSRIRQLVKYLSQKNSWKPFFGNDVKWEKATLVGHSQGAGHVAYLSKIFGVKKVIMTGGPHDQYADGTLAAWVEEPGVTGEEKYFSLLHRDDFFGTVEALGVSRSLSGETEVTYFRDVLPSQKTQILMSDFPFRDPHNSLNDNIYKNVWDFLLD